MFATRSQKCNKTSSNYAKSSFIVLKNTKISLPFLNIATKGQDWTPYVRVSWKSESAGSAAFSAFFHGNIHRQPSERNALADRTIRAARANHSDVNELWQTNCSLYSPIFFFFLSFNFFLLKPILVLTTWRVCVSICACVRRVSSRIAMGVRLFYSRPFHHLKKITFYSNLKRVIFQRTQVRVSTFTKNLKWFETSEVLKCWNRTYACSSMSIPKYVVFL